MKGAAPVERPRHSEIVPFHSDAHGFHVAIERPPPLLHIAPGGLFGRALKTHRHQLTNGGGPNARLVSFPPMSPGPTFPGWRPRHRCFGQNPATPRLVTWPSGLLRKAG